MSVIYILVMIEAIILFNFSIALNSINRRYHLNCLKAINNEYPSTGISNNFENINRSQLNEQKSVRNILYRIIPLHIQHFFRENGIISVLNNVSAAIIGFGLLLRSSKQLRIFLELQNKLYVFNYGTGKRKFLEVIIHSCSEEPMPIVIFVHGGGWGSGETFQYRMSANGVGTSIRARAVIVVGYEYYPQCDIFQQRDSILDAIRFIKDDARIQNLLGDGRKTYVLCGHSSGAHICSMALLAQNNSTSSKSAGNTSGKLVDTFISLSGVFDITEHYKHEAKNGIHEMSPMKAAAGGFEGFAACSPTTIIHNSLSSKEEENTVDFGSFPYSILLHGIHDRVVPVSSSELFADALRRASISYDTVFPPVIRLIHIINSPFD